MTSHEEDQWAMKYLDAIKAKDMATIMEIEMNPELDKMVAGIKAHLQGELWITQFRNLVLKKQVEYLETCKAIPPDERVLSNFKYRFYMQRLKEVAILSGMVDSFEEQFRGYS